MTDLKQESQHSSTANADEQVRIAITTTFAQCLLPTLRRLTVDVQRGHAKLQGSVYSFHEKQIAYHLSRKVPGVEAVSSEIRVISRPRPLSVNAWDDYSFPTGQLGFPRRWEEHAVHGGR